MNKKMFLNWNSLLLIFLLLLSVYVISPHFGNEGIAIRGVEEGSVAQLAGIVSPDESVRQVDYERILQVSGQDVRSLEEYFDALRDSGSTVILTTNVGEYVLQNFTNSTGLQVTLAHTTNIQTGLDLQGGTRLIIQPEEDISAELYEDLRDNLEKRLNPNGILDVRVTNIKESIFAAKPSFVSIEVAGITSDEIERLVLRQGKFEAKILNETVYDGSGVAAVNTGSQHAGIQSCSGRGAVETTCRFSFPISLTPDAARAFGEATGKLSVVGGSLSAPIELYLDGQLMDSLSISADLRGRSETGISISGSGSGPSEAVARENALNNMRDLQIILSTGSLPSKISVVKSENISATLGESFLQNALFVGFLATIVVSLLVFIRYRTPKYAIPMIIVSLSEVVLLMGLAVIINWNIDLASIAGIIIILGSGFDHLIILTDETRSKKNAKQRESWKRKFRKALFIILTAYFTTVAAMLPLGWAGAGILRGFAFTTIAGITIAVLITRPTYAKILEYLQE